jgi:hypothetical protein
MGRARRPVRRGSGNRSAPRGASGATKVDDCGRVGPTRRWERGRRRGAKVRGGVGCPVARLRRRRRGARVGAGRAAARRAMADDVARGAPWPCMPVRGPRRMTAILALADDRRARAGASGSHKTLGGWRCVEAGVDLAHRALIPHGPRTARSWNADQLPRPPQTRVGKATYPGEPGVLALASTPALDSATHQASGSRSRSSAGRCQRARADAQPGAPARNRSSRPRPGPNHDRDRAQCNQSTGAPVAPSWPSCVAARRPARRAW